MKFHNRHANTPNPKLKAKKIGDLHGLEGTRVNSVRIWSNIFEPLCSRVFFSRLFETKNQ